MSEANIMIQLRHGPPEPTEVFVGSLPQQVVDEWYRSNWPRRACRPAWRRRTLMASLGQDKQQKKITELLVQYYSSHE